MGKLIDSFTNGASCDASYRDRASRNTEDDPGGLARRLMTFIGASTGLEDGAGIAPELQVGGQPRRS